MPQFIKLKADSLNEIRKIDKRLVSYNIEMTEITGGTFWKAYTPEQIAGMEEFPKVQNLNNVTAMSELMQYYPPIDLYNERLRELAKKIGTAWIRVSGTWATKTFYDFNNETDGKIPDGYQSILTKKQWIGVLDFVKAVGGKLLISVSNCAGDHPNGGVLDLAQTKKIFNFSHEYGVDIDAAEFMNEPNMLEFSGAPKGYTAADFARDQDIFNGWVRENYPKCLIVGPCTTGDNSFGTPESENKGAGIGSMMKVCTTDDLMNGAKVNLDVFSYHYYNGISERLASVMPSGHWNADMAHTDAYLAVAENCVKNHLALRDKYVLGGQIWVTESGDAGGGGNTWASTYLDVFRTLNEFGSFAALTDGVIFHNTLASSDYGFLKYSTFEPRPNYFAALLWNTLMGETVYDCRELNAVNTHVYCHSRKDGKAGYAYLIINNSIKDYMSIEIPKTSEIYKLSAESLRASVMKLNGKELYNFGEFIPEYKNAGTIELAPASCTFIVM